MFAATTILSRHLGPLAACTCPQHAHLSLCSIYEKIGKGKHSTVYKGRKKKTIQYHAIKSVDKSQKPRVLQEVCYAAVAFLLYPPCSTAGACRAAQPRKRAQQCSTYERNQTRFSCNKDRLQHHHLAGLLTSCLF
jgi:hypothetical protein